MKKSMKDAFIIGFALFAMFFGAGNLIFPVYLGKITGSSFIPAILGFIITATGLPMLGIIAGIKSGGSPEGVASKLDKRFAILILTALVLCIGPLFAIPRTAATTFEIAVKPFLPQFSPLLFNIIFFAINIAFVIKPSKIIDIIGAVLTPVLLLTLLILIVKGIINPVGTFVSTPSSGVFAKSFIEGYQTMDAMAAVIFSSIIISAVKSKGYKEEKDVFKITVLAGLVAVIGLGLSYGGLVYIGAQASTAIPGDIEKVQLISILSGMILGNSGSVVLAIAVSLACFTTSVGLIATAAQYFENLFHKKIGYKANVLIISLVSLFIATQGVDKIINLAVPVLSIIYPVVIVLIFSKLGEKYIVSEMAVKATTYVTFVVAVLDTLNLFEFKSVLATLPLANLGFAWVTPALIVFFLFNIRKSYVLRTQPSKK